MNFKARISFLVAFAVIVLIIYVISKKPPLRSTKALLNDEDDAKLCVLVPFRERFDELLDFIPHISAFLQRQRIRFRIYVINQVDPFRFNRAKLFNAGFKSADDDAFCDYIVLHDVDLLPINDRLSYGIPPEATPIFHASPPGLHPKYDYPTFIGGILIMRRSVFERVNGMSNLFWGWGLEDDEFYARIKEAGFAIGRPDVDAIGSGIHNTFKHVGHVTRKRKRDYRKCYNQRDVTKRRDRETGLDNVDFDLKATRTLRVDDAFEAVVLDVALRCDRDKTPFCDCTNAPATESPQRPVEPGEKILPFLPNKKRGLV